jgi:uncharacterized protein (DUF2236 family)
MQSMSSHHAAIRARLIEANLRRPGPESISWRINREIIVVAGWGRAVLLQLAHPGVAAGVHDHSSFRGSLRASLRRMRSTVRAMLSITFGDTEQMIAAAAGINAIHDRVHGHGYCAHDPDLQCWVHATLLDSSLESYERLVGPLTAHERDRYCAEAAIMEPLMGMPRGLLPRSWVELRMYIRGMMAGDAITVTETSRALAKAVLSPPHWYVAWPAFRPLQLITIGSLPPGIREAYGFEWRAREERALARWTTLIRTSLRLLPQAAREWPISRSRPMLPIAAGRCGSSESARRA